MTPSEVVVYVKNAMRITHTALDSTLSADVEAGALDAFERGVSVFTLVNDAQVQAGYPASRSVLPRERRLPGQGRYVQTRL